MWFSRSPKLSYDTLESFDNDQDEPKVAFRQPTTMAINISLFPALLLALLLCISTASTWILFFQKSGQVVKTTSSHTAQWDCVNPATRQEWRTLTPSDKNTYINAVKCLQTKPSRVGTNGTLYDDFSWVHKHASSKSHASSPFFPWHRYFIHIFEKALVDDCAYPGALPYWDWSLDWQDFTKSPIWNIDSFGGNGDPSDSLSVGGGHCVTDGPFAGLEIVFYDDDYHPHCLSRNFESGQAMRNLGKLVRPEAIAEIMEEDDYEAFTSRLEHNAHHFLSASVRGDFSKFTGPNDPVFFLHHTNLDRLWWEWQMKDPNRRLHAYGAKATKNEIRTSSLLDHLDVAGLRHNIPVYEVMETTTGLFCYKY